MNILQITNTVCTNTNQATGVNRIVTQLSQYWARVHQDNCFLSFFEYAYNNNIKCERGIEIALFKATYNIKYSFTPHDFESFLLNHHIDIIIFNFAANQMLRFLKDICTIARKNNIKVIYCHHFMPGSEGFSHGSLEEVLYNINSSKDIFDKSKKWLTTITKPFSTKFIHKVIKKKYEVPYLECDKLVVFTQTYIYKYLNIVNGKNEQKFEVIPNPLSFSEFLPKDQLKNKTKEIIFVGRLVEAQKRVSAILKIWKLVEQNPLLTDWTLKIVGEGKDETFLHWLTKRYQLKRVSFEGRQDPKPYYEKASIMVSTSAYEGWPMVLMEAMPMGCCCLAFDSYDAIHDIIEDNKNGKIIPNNNIKAYYNALSELMLNDEKRIAMMLSAIDSSKQFSMEVIGEKWRDLLVKMCYK